MSFRQPRNLTSKGAFLVARVRHALRAAYVATASFDDSVYPEWLVASAVAALLGASLLAAAGLDAIGLPLFWPIFAGCVLALPLLFFRSYGRPAFMASFLIEWFAFHKLVIAILAPYLRPEIVAWLVYYKEAIYLTAFGVALVVSMKRFPWERILSVRWVVQQYLSRADLFALAIIALVSVYFVIGLILTPGEAGTELVYARRLASLPVIFVLGRLLVPGKNQLWAAIRVMVGVAAIVATFGLVQRLLLGGWFWTHVVRVDVLQTSLVSDGFGSDYARLVNGMPANWTTYFGQLSVTRLVSTFLEPTTLALFLALATAVTAFSLPEWRRTRFLSWSLLLATMMLALLLTFGKGGLVTLAVVGLAWASRVTKQNAVRVGAILVALGLAVLVIGYWSPLGPNLARHLHGLWSGLMRAFADPLGSGLGSTGFWGKDVLVGGDSAVGVIASQLGILGALLWIGWLLAVGYALLPQQSGRDELRPALHALSRTLAGAISGLLIVSVVSNSATGLLGSAVYLLFGGWLISVGSREVAPSQAAMAH